jgi:hypothetical protein
MFAKGDNTDHDILQYLWGNTLSQQQNQSYVPEGKNSREQDQL